MDTGSNFDYQYDRYHPTVDGALEGGSDCLHPANFRIGFWDDSGRLTALDIALNGSPWRHINNPNLLANGKYDLALRGADLTPLLSVLVKIAATDASGNTQRYEKSVKELVQQCVASGRQLYGPNNQVSKSISPAGRR